MNDDSPQGQRRGIIELLIGATIISLSPVFVRAATVEPTPAGFYRTLFGGGALLIYVLARREPLWRGWRPFGYAFAGGVLFAADLTFWHRAISYIGPGLATILGNFQAFFLAAFGILVLGERPDWRFLVAVPVAILGLVLLVGVDWNALDSDSKIGVAYGIATALVYASYLLVYRRSQVQSHRLTPAASLTVITLSTAAIMGIEGGVQGETFRIADSFSWGAMVGYGVICQALGWIVISHGLRRVPASRAGLILLLQPTLAFIWDIVLFRRPTDGLDLFGAGLALGAIYLGSLGSSRAKTAPDPKLAE